MTKDTKKKSIVVGSERLGEMTTRERFVRTLHYQAVDHVPHMEFGYWASLKDRWLAEGHLPQSLASDNGEISNEGVESFFGCERRVGVGPAIEAGPHRPIEVVGEREGKLVYRNGLGVLCEEVKEGIRSIPHFLEFPIKDRPSWERFRDEFLDIDAEWRPRSEPEIDDLARQLASSTHPVGISFGSFIGHIRDWIGFQGLAYMSYDDPVLLEEIVAHVAELKMRYLPPLLDKIEFDFASGWEDIAFNSGPLLSPGVFREIILPYMRPVMKLLRQHGIDIIFTDCDGNIQALIPLWLEVGLNCMFPYEINAGNAAVANREKYGRDLLIIGGFDKFALFDSKEAVLAQFRKLEPLLADGGFIPHIDHRCPDGVSFQMYQYYIREKCHFLGIPDEQIEAIPGLSAT